MVDGIPLEKAEKWIRKAKVDRNEAKKRKKKYITGMPIRAIKALIKSPKTPLHIKAAWQKKLRELG